MSHLEERMETDLNALRDWLWKLGDDVEEAGGGECHADGGQRHAEVVGIERGHEQHQWQGGH